MSKIISSQLSKISSLSVPRFEEEITVNNKILNYHNELIKLFNSLPQTLDEELFNKKIHEETLSKIFSIKKNVLTSLLHENDKWVIDADNSSEIARSAHLAHSEFKDDKNTIFRESHKIVVTDEALWGFLRAVTHKPENSPARELDILNHFSRREKAACKKGDQILENEQKNLKDAMAEMQSQWTEIEELRKNLRNEAIKLR